MDRVTSFKGNESTQLKHFIEEKGSMKDTTLVMRLLHANTELRADPLLYRMSLNLLDYNIQEMKYLQKLYMEKSTRVYGVADVWNALEVDQI